MPGELGDLDPECQRGHANPICASTQIPVGASCIPRRRRDVPAVILPEVDLAPDSLPRQFEPHDCGLSRPFHPRTRPAQAAETHDDATESGIEPLRITVRSNLVDSTKQLLLDGTIRRALTGLRVTTTGQQYESHQPDRRPAKRHA